MTVTVLVIYAWIGVLAAFVWLLASDLRAERARTSAIRREVQDLRVRVQRLERGERR